LPFSPVKQPFVKQRLNDTDEILCCAFFFRSLIFSQTNNKRIFPMKKIYTAALAAFGLLAAELPAQNYNVQFQGQLMYGQQTLANICGYRDSLGNEYALCGASQGMSIVDVTNPAAPVQVAQIPNVDDLWKEIKVYKGFAYVTTEGNGGALQIVDMRGLPNTTLPRQYYFGDGAIAGQLSTVHALHIDTTLGYCYLFGSNIGQGGAVVLDLNADPYNPTYVGEYQQNGYVHDGYVDNDTLYAGHIYAGFFTVVDMTNKTAPVVLATQTTPTAFTHNVWISDDRNFLFTTDENTNSFLGAYDISNLSNIQEVDRMQTTPGSGSVVHNTHILNNWAITSWYKDGFNIVDVTRPHNLVEVGRYDTYAGTGNGFEGAWGVYPFLPSGTIVVSNIDEGLFVLSPTYVRACYLEGTVTDSTCGTPLTGVTITISSVNVTTTSDIAGNFATGTHLPGTYTVTFSKPGYTSVVMNNVVFAPGQVNLYNINMFSPNNVSINGTVTDAASSSVLQNVQVSYTSSSNTYSFTSDVAGQYSNCNGITDLYTIGAAQWGYLMYCAQDSVTPSASSAQISLQRGYEDEFTFDLGWTVSGTALSGSWERGEPVGTSYLATNDANPDVDVNSDCTDKCFVTGNGGGNASNDDVDGGQTTLSSPLFDLTTYNDPWIHYDRWFFNAGGSGNPNDSMVVRLTNGTVTTTVENVNANTAGMSSWVHRAVRVNPLMTKTASMRLTVQIADQQPGHLLEGAFDHFYVVDSNAVSVPEVEQQAAVTAFPNPFSGQVQINYTLPSQFTGKAVLEITDVTGRIVAMQQLNGTQGVLLSGDQLGGGVYFVRIIAGTEVLSTTRIVKTN
jgi:choice-of-anchor B domain-containing protein